MVKGESGIGDMTNPALSFDRPEPWSEASAVRTGYGDAAVYRATYEPLEDDEGWFATM
jgi:hypothetical protein